MLQPTTRIVMTAFCLLWPLLGTADARLAEPARLDAPALANYLPSLRQGGYVIYIRHMATDHTQEDQRPVDLRKCATQRQLSAKGREQARMMGKALHRLNIPVGEVFSSPFCRCKASARLALGHFTTSDKLYFAMDLSRSGRQAKGQVLREMLASRPAAGQNTFIIAHTANLQEAVGLWPKPEGVAYIFRPLAGGKFELIGKVDPETWAGAGR